MKNCENCGIEHEGTYGSGRFCSKKCARGFSTKAKRKEINQKVSEKRKASKHPKVKKICLACKNEFEVPWNARDRKYCSIQCSTIKNNDPIIKAKIALKMAERIANGTHTGWKFRKEGIPSYPEQYFMKLFKKNKIVGWKKEFKVGKWFIDFAFIDIKLALEIDGSQHLLEERKEHDKIKDEYLKNNGWTVFRIKWYNPINENNKEKLYPQIEEFKRVVTTEMKKAAGHRKP
jgi:very-short-patch-repair endonuclease